MMRRRDFIMLLCGAAAWPLAARAQQAADKMRRIGMLLPASADNRDYQTWAGVFLQGLGQLGGTSAAMCRSTPAGPQHMPTTFADMRRN